MCELYKYTYFLGTAYNVILQNKEIKRWFSPLFLCLALVIHVCNVIISWWYAYVDYTLFQGFTKLDHFVTPTQTPPIHHHSPTLTSPPPFFIQLRSFFSFSFSFLFPFFYLFYKLFLLILLLLFYVFHKRTATCALTLK